MRFFIQLDPFSSDLQRLEDHWVATGEGTGLQIPHLKTGTGGAPKPGFSWLGDHLR